MDRVGDKTIGRVLLIAFRTRYKEVLIKAHTAAFEATAKFLSLLTEEEVKCETFKLVRSVVLVYDLCTRSNVIHLILFTLKYTRQLSPLPLHLRSGERVAPDFRKLLFLGEKGSQFNR